MSLFTNKEEIINEKNKIKNIATKNLKYKIHYDII